MIGKPGGMLYKLSDNFKFSEHLSTFSYQLFETEILNFHPILEWSLPPIRLRDIAVVKIYPKVVDLGKENSMVFMLEALR